VERKEERTDARKVSSRLTPVLQAASKEVNCMPSRRPSFPRACPYSDARLGGVKHGRGDDETSGGFGSGVDLKPERERKSARVEEKEGEKTNSWMSILKVI
jgi:hypothetical protein